jgi:MoaA/NifB/PqqE/SkfB family radical SAM enzyme
MLELARAIPLNWLFRRFGRPRVLPFSLTLSLTCDCNARCRTCHIHNRQAEDLTPAEWQQIFACLGHSPFWVTFSGGEPFLRPELPEIAIALHRHCRPRVINIPTNGLLTGRITETADRVTRACPEARLVINLSVDDIGERHDALRGVPGNYRKVMESFKALKRLPARNLTIGFHTVISKFNVERIPEIYRTLQALGPDSLITEIAEERVELDTVGRDIAPSPEAYGRAVDFLVGEMKKERWPRAGKVTRAFRMEYYRQVKQLLAEKREIIPCYAGCASAQIAPDGQVWLCCVKAEPLGSLRESGYDFRKIWFSPAVRAAQRDVVQTRCSCPLANVAYTNMLHHPGSLFRVALNWLR